MKNYVSPEIEVIKSDALEVLGVSIGDVDVNVGDGFFFTVGYGDMTGGDLLKELLYYGVSSINLSTTGSEQQGVRACTSRMRNELYPVMEERMKAFHEDHQIK